MEDKSNGRVNRRLMGKFKSLIDELELIELPLHGRKFTWNAGQHADAQTTMTKIDRVFYSTSWEELFPSAHLHAWASTILDHCPLILQGDIEAKKKFRGFRFESYWLKLPGFLDVVREAWAKPLQATDALRSLHIKLARTAKDLKTRKRITLETSKSN
jgi:hypothetical protein